MGPKDLVLNPRGSTWPFDGTVPRAGREQFVELWISILDPIWHQMKVNSPPNNRDDWYFNWQESMNNTINMYFFWLIEFKKGTLLSVLYTCWSQDELHRVLEPQTTAQAENI